MLTNNSSAPMFEIRLKNNELQKQLFTYISGGTKTPEFLINKFYKENNKKLDIEYINLNIFIKKMKCLQTMILSFSLKRMRRN